MEITDNSDGTTSVQGYDGSNPDHVKKLGEHAKEGIMRNMGLRPAPKELLGMDKELEQEPKRSKKELDKIKKQ